MTDTLDQLEADLDAFIVSDIDLEAEPPTLAGIGDADRALRQIARLDRDLARYEALAKHRVEQIQAWLHDRSDIILRRREWWERSAEGWMRAHHAETGIKTEKLPSGTLQIRAAKPRVEALTREPGDDIDANLVRVQRQWDKRQIADACTPGPELDDIEAPDGYTAHAAITPDGAALEGVALLVPVKDSFSMRAGE